MVVLQSVTGSSGSRHALETTPRRRQHAKEESATALEVAVRIAVPLAIAAGLLYYWSWIRVRSFYDSFGVGTGLLGFTTNEMFLHSSNALFRPIMWTLVITVVATLLALTLEALQRRKPFYPYRFGVAYALVAIPAVLIVVITALLGAVPTPTAAWVLLIGGIGAVVTSRIHYATTGVGRTSGLLVGGALIAAAAFWLTTITAQSQGVADARALIAYQAWAADHPASATRNPDTAAMLTTAIVHSSERLPLQGEVVGPPADPTVEPAQKSWRYSYSGYQVLLYSGDRWILVAASPKKDPRPTVVLPKSDQIQIDLEGSLFSPLPTIPPLVTNPDVRSDAPASVQAAPPTNLLPPVGAIGATAAGPANVPPGLPPLPDLPITAGGPPAPGQPPTSLAPTTSPAQPGTPPPNAPPKPTAPAYASNADVIWDIGKGGWGFWAGAIWIAL